MARPKKKQRGRKPQWELPQIDATPEELARAILTQPPRKPEDWPYMQEEAERKARMRDRS